MPTLTEAIGALKTAISTASGAAAGSPDGAALQAAYERREAVLREMEKALIRAEGEARALERDDAGARQGAADYFDAVAALRASLAAADGLAAALAAEKDALRAALGEPEGAADADWLDPLRAAIAPLDPAIQAPVTAAEAEVAGKAADHVAALETFAARRRALEQGRLQIANHAARAAQLAQAVYKHLEDARKARGRGDHAGAVVALDKAMAGLARVTGPVEIEPPDLAFDADNASAAALDSALRSEWAPLKVSYQNALANLIEKETALLQARLALAGAQIAALQKQATRDADAAAAVQAAL